MGKLSIRVISIFVLCLAASILFSLGSMSMNQAQSRPDGGKREQYVLPEDNLYKSPIQLALSKNGKRLYVACENSNEILVVDMTGYRVVDAVKVPHFSAGIQFQVGKIGLQQNVLLGGEHQGGNFFCK